MARRGGMKLHGVRQLEARSKEYTRRLSDRALSQEALAEAAEPVREAASAKAPRGATGTLQSGIVVATSSTAHRVWQKTAGADRAKVGVGPDRDAFYGMFQEIGTSFHAAQPFLRPAVDSAGREVVGRYRGALKAVARTV